MPDTSVCFTMMVAFGSFANSMSSYTSAVNSEGWLYVPNGVVCFIVAEFIFACLSKPSVMDDRYVHCIVSLLV